MKKINANSVSLLVVLIFTVVTIVLSLKLEFFASKLLPMLISIAVFILAFFALIGELKAKNRIEVAPDNTEVEENRDQVKHLFVMAAWITGFFIAIYILGFVIASPLFVASYMRQHGSTWLEMGLTTFIFTAIFYTVFNVALNADLYHGSLLIWLGF